MKNANTGTDKEKNDNLKDHTDDSYMSWMTKSYYQNLQKDLETFRKKELKNMRSKKRGHARER